MDLNNLPKGEFKIIIKDDDFVILDSNGNQIYAEYSNGATIYYGNSDGGKYFFDSNGIRYTEQELKERNQSCDGKIITFEGKQYQLKEI